MDQQQQNGKIENAENSPVERVELSSQTIGQHYGLQMEKAYKIAVHLYREQEKDGSLTLDYHHRLRFIALSKQAKFGEFKENEVDCGWFDFIGNDARKAWKSIGKLSAEEAMLEFIRLLDAVCPTFRTQLEQNKRFKIDKVTAAGPQGNSADPASREVSAKQKLDSFLQKTSVESQEIIEQFEQQKRQIQEALNKQTYHQFLAYAQQTHPGESEKQEQLIKQLQEQHYQQYMAQVYAQAQAASQAAIGTPTVNSTPPNNVGGVIDPESGLSTTVGRATSSVTASNGKVKSVDELADDMAALEADSDVSDEEDADNEAPANPRVAPANMWTTKNLQEFKETIKKEGPEGVLKIGHGETVTVRVPTHPEGNSLFWEFCTDYYDLGFGVYFEWTVSDSNQVTVHVEETEDEYEEEETAESGATPATGDVEAEAAKKQKDANKPRVDEIIPTFRRDCHEEVFSGSHVYPGRGVYLLKFDNSYSLWRSKTLYYRVFYSK